MGQKRTFQGTGTALVTPFKKNGSLDEKALRNLVEFQIRGGVQALIPVGTTGESPTLTYKEHYHVFDVVIEQANGRAKIFAGTGSNNTVEAIEQSQHAKKAGADAVLVVGPYYNKPTQEGYYQHYRKIAETVDIPVIIYNVPGRTGGNIEASTTLRMAAEIPNIMAVKEASGNMAQIMEIARNKPAGFSLLSGDDAFTLPMMAVGGDGCISVVANELPKEFSDLVTHCLHGRWDKALALHNRLLPLMNVNFIEANPIPVKAALAMMGMIEEVYRLPLVPLAEKNREKLRSVMKELKLL
jgi:4-hydroxy-tetrahydrodipicolinate synthase